MGRRHGLFHGVEDRHAVDGLAALARHHAPDDIGAVVDHFLGVKAADPPGDALDDDAAFAVEIDAHQTALSLEFWL